MARKRLEVACFLGPPVALSLSTKLGQVSQHLLYVNDRLQQWLRWRYSIQVLLCMLILILSVGFEDVIAMPYSVVSTGGAEATAR